MEEEDEIQTIDNSAEDPKLEKLLARKRVFWVIVACCFIALAFLIWELVDLGLGGV